MKWQRKAGLVEASPMSVLCAGCTSVHCQHPAHNVMFLSCSTWFSLDQRGDPPSAWREAEWCFIHILIWAVCLAFHQLQDKTENRLIKFIPTQKIEGLSTGMNIAGDLPCVFSCSLSRGSLNDYLWEACFVVSTGLQKKSRETQPQPLWSSSQTATDQPITDGDRGCWGTENNSGRPISEMASGKALLRR